MSVPNPPEVRRTPRIIPVLDIMNGVVVRAVGGRRSEYRPIESKLTRSTAPLDVAKALLDTTGANELYVADLDAIMNRRSVSLPVVKLVERVTIPILLDAGSGMQLPLMPHVRSVLSLESGYGQRAAWWDLQTGYPHCPLRAFSIDLMRGRLLGNWEAWEVPNDQAVAPLAQRVYELGGRTLLVLDLANVGEDGGPATEPHCRAIREALPDVELIAGGGVRGWDDVHRLGDAGADAVLVASALHDGRLP